MFVLSYLAHKHNLRNYHHRAALLAQSLGVSRYTLRANCGRSPPTVAPKVLSDAIRNGFWTHQNWLPHRWGLLIS